MGKSVVITSGKGGVGKTTLSVWLGRALAKESVRVVLADADFGMGNLDVALGAEENVVSTLEETLAARARLSSALLPDVYQKNLFALCSRSAPPPSALDALPDLFRQLEESFDFLLIDCPAGVGSGFRRAARTAKEALLVTTPHIGAVRDADRTLTALAPLDCPVTGLIVNRVDSRAVLSRAQPHPLEIASLLRLPLLGALPEDPALSRGEPPAPLTRAALSLTAKRLLGNDVPVFDPDKTQNPFYSLRLRRLTHES